ncbi:MAG: hypothetical protein WCE62_18305 [Polyangiales bacterium]
MARNRKQEPHAERSDAGTKLTHLLKTENALEAMLKQARREAEELVEAARVAAEGRVRRFELEIEEEDLALRERIARDRERTIETIKREALQQTKRMDQLDDAKITELALHLLDLVVGEPDTRGRP